MFSNSDLHALYKTLEIEQDAVNVDKNEHMIFEYRSKHYYRPDIALYDIKQKRKDSVILTRNIDYSSVFQKYLIYRTIQLRDSKISVQFEPFRDKLDLSLFITCIKHRVLYLSKDAPSITSFMYVIK